MQNHNGTESPAWHALSPQQVLQALDSTPHGLSQKEAEQRRRRYGPNRLPSPPRPAGWRRFLAQFDNLLIYILLAAAVITATLGYWVDTAAILGVVFINAVIGFIQEGKAEDALDAIRRLLTPKAVVRRDGRLVEITAEEVVPGDIVLLAAGDRVAADLRLLETHELAIDESLLTGESVPQEKRPAANAPDTPLAERHAMAYSGTLVTRGSGIGVAVATGPASEIGRIGALLEQVQTLRTPLQDKLDRFARGITAATLLLAALAFTLGLLRGYGWMEMFLASVGLAVALIPEGLPAILTITLTVGVRRMARRQAIIRRLPAVETLGAVTVICSDKTGTLTKNEMTLTRIALPTGQVEVEGAGYDPHGDFLLEGETIDPLHHPALELLLRAGALCNDAELHLDATGPHIAGDPLEAALLVAAVKAGMELDRLQEQWPRLDTLPFDTARRYMATLHHDHQGHVEIFLKGAPERVMDLCSHQWSEHGPRPLERAWWEARAHELASQGLRLLAIAHRPLPPGHTTLQENDLDSMVLLGLIGVIDPPRPEAIRAVETARRAGIQVKMITGDHAITAQAIGRQLGIGDGRRTLTGAELADLPGAALRQAVREVDIFARTTPEQKLQLVEALQANGEVTAMTGDGVNDAPALRRADIGIAMGAKGSEVAKEAAEMVLADDNFATIVHAVEEGRTLYDNIKKALLFILPTNGGQAGVILAAVALGTALPVSAAQILWINMITTVTLALALAFEPAEGDVMHRPPRSPKAPLLNGYLLWRILFVAALMVAGTFFTFHWGLDQGMSLEQARTLAVNTIVVFEAYYLFNSRYFQRSALRLDRLLRNRIALLALGTLVLIQTAYTYAPPLQHLFQSAPLTVEQWALIFALGAILFLVVELEKALALKLGFRA